MHRIITNLAALVTLAAIAVTALILAATVPPAQASAGPSCNDWHTVHRIDRYTTWQYVTRDEARYEHIRMCSKVITGTDGSVIFSRSGYVADES